MSTPFIGQILMFGGNFAPIGWAFCNGQLLNIAEYDALFALIGTTYGGDGVNTFGLPNLQGRLPIHQGQGPGLSNYVQGTAAGTEQVNLTVPQIPAHQHPARCQDGSASQTGPGGAVWATSSASLYSSTGPTVAMNAANVGNNTGGQPHENRMPFLAITFIIALEGIFPSQN